MTELDAERRRELQAERAKLQLRIADWSMRVERAGKTTAGDLVVPALGGCAFSVPLFAALAIYAVSHATPGVRQGITREIVLGCVAIFAVMAAIAFWIRNRMRNSRIAEARRTHTMAMIPLRERLREIDRLLAG
jgi:hypothetical protein